MNNNAKNYYAMNQQRERERERGLFFLYSIESTIMTWIDGIFSIEISKDIQQIKEKRLILSLLKVLLDLNEI